MVENVRKLSDSPERPKAFTVSDWMLRGRAWSFFFFFCFFFFFSSSPWHTSAFIWMVTPRRVPGIPCERGKGESLSVELPKSPQNQLSKAQNRQPCIEVIPRGNPPLKNAF